MWGRSTKFWGMLLLLCLAVIYPQPVLLFGRVLGWKGSLGAYKGNKRFPGTPGVKGQTDPRGRRQGPGMPFGMVGPLSWKPTWKGVSLTVEGNDNKNTG